MRIFPTYAAFAEAEGIDTINIDSNDWFETDWEPGWFRNKNGSSPSHTYGWLITWLTHRSVFNGNYDGHGWLIAYELSGDTLDSRRRTGRVALIRKQWCRSQDEEWSSYYTGAARSSETAGTVGREAGLTEIDRSLPGEVLQ